MYKSRYIIDIDPVESSFFNLVRNWILRKSGVHEVNVLTISFKAHLLMKGIYLGLMQQVSSKIPVLDFINCRYKIRLSKSYLIKKYCVELQLQINHWTGYDLLFVYLFGKVYNNKETTCYNLKLYSTE